MAEIIVKYDARNLAARSIIEMLYKSGLFKVEDKKATLTKDEIKFSNEFKQALKEADEIKNHL
jgi:predicted transcriptional regulator